jgi:hypothetical protein
MDYTTLKLVYYFVVFTGLLFYSGIFYIVVTVIIFRPHSSVTLLRCGSKLCAGMMFKMYMYVAHNCLDRVQLENEINR